jgi:hypothetical protein
MQYNLVYLYHDNNAVEFEEGLVMFHSIPVSFFYHTDYE